jgi:hypothetical protein
MIGVAIALLLGAQGVAPPEARDQIVVRGQRLDHEAAVRYVTEISRPVGNQLPIFHDPICPEVIGLPADQGARVANRIRKVTKFAGLSLAAEGCKPNVHLIVVADGASLIAGLRNDPIGYFEGVSPSEMGDLLKPGRRVRSWSNVQIQNEDGLTFAENQPGRSAFDNRQRIRTRGGGDGDTMLSPITTGDGKVMRVMSASITKLPTRQSTLHSFVVLETAQVTGKSLTQIADYATMRTLAAAKPPNEGVAVDTILTLFDEGREAPPSVSASDAAYLKALYKSPGTASYQQQLVRLSKAVVNGTAEITKATN